MKVDLQEEKCFGNLNGGNVFQFLSGTSGTWIKVREPYTSTGRYSALRLSDGEIETFRSHERVRVLQVKLVSE